MLFCSGMCCAESNVVDYVDTCCSSILSLLRRSPGIAVLQVQGNLCAVLLHVFLSLLHGRFKEFKGQASSHCPKILLVLAPTGDGECAEG